MPELALGGMPMIVVTHEMGFAREAADRVVMMDDGCIIEEGSPEHFFVASEQERTKQFMSKILADLCGDRVDLGRRVAPVLTERAVFDAEGLTHELERGELLLTDEVEPLLPAPPRAVLQHRRVLRRKRVTAYGMLSDRLDHVAPGHAPPAAAPRRPITMKLPGTPARVSASASSRTMSSLPTSGP
jgi:hypothetical protein